MHDIDLSGARVLVTGVSAGIGRETARVLAEHGARVAKRMFAVLERRYAVSGSQGVRSKLGCVRAAAVHPGAVLADTTRKLIEAQPAAASAFTWKTVAQGAATPIWAGFSAPADEIGGRYCEDCRVAEMVDGANASSGVRSYALDPHRAFALWVKSREMVGETT